MPSSHRRRIPPVPTWTCPQCGIVHHTADLLRIGWDTLQCKGCQKVFDSKADAGDKKGEEGEP